ncbi:Thioredoxin [Taenia solium]|uniref:Thioredoxin n=1 Tax=Taenia asiatica TaxID=60517 RepID=A0A0R3W892_TAEAS|nr:unnamed protein product [Taenia asiatica]|eukprot:TsM_000898500 transcript=TsM_000898500 gene=TsM_000898500
MSGGASTTAVRHVDAEGLKRVLGDNRLVVINFCAPWCGPCRLLAPKVEQLAKQHQDVVFVKVDIDECEEVSAEYNVSALPTLIAVRNGHIVGRVVGASEADLQQMVNANRD